MKAVVKSYFGNTEVAISTKMYVKPSNLAIQLWCEDGPYATLTINLTKRCKPNCSFVDTNNCHWAEEFISEYKLGKPTGKTEISGWCCYPEYEFNLKEIAKYNNLEEV